jgi:hypothetical protein
VESNTAGKKSKSFIIITFILILCISAITLWAWKGLHKAQLSSFVRKDLPMLALQLHFIDSNGKDIPPGQTRLASDFAVSSSKACPEIKGGDLHGGSGVKVGDKLGQGCSNTVSWYVKRHPTGMSLYFNDPEKIRSFFEKNSTFKEIWQSRFIQGIFHDPLGNASIRAEDLGLQGLEGTFIATLFRESLAAHAQLHYDVVHGRKGFVYSFVRNECAYA